MALIDKGGHAIGVVRRANGFPRNYALVNDAVVAVCYYCYEDGRMDKQMLFFAFGYWG